MRKVKIENGEIVQGIELRQYPKPEKDGDTHYPNGVSLVGGWATRLKKYRELNIDKVLKDGAYVPIEDVEWVVERELKELTDMIAELRGVFPFSEEGKNNGAIIGSPKDCLYQMIRDCERDK